MPCVRLSTLRNFVPLCLLAIACGSKTPSVPAQSVDAVPGECEAPSKVHGRLVTVFGNAVSGRRVLIPGHPVVESDENGEFTVDDVACSYEAVVLDAEAVLVFQGITRRDPTFTARTTGEPHTSIARGRASGGAGFPAPELHGGGAVLKAEGGRGSPATINQQTGDYDLDASWDDEDRLTDLVAHGLQWRTKADGRFDLFTGYGSSAPFFLRAAQSSDGHDLVLSGLGTRRLSGTVSLPPGARLIAVSCAVDFGGGAEVTVWGEDNVVDGLATSFECPVPVLPSARAKVYLEVNSGSGRLTASRAGEPGVSGTVQVSLAAPPSFVSPAEGATDVSAATLFSWTGGSGVARLSMIPMDGLRFVVVTAKAEARLPDLTPLGVSLPRGMGVQMSVTSRAEIATVDEALVVGWESGGVGGTKLASESGTRQFSTAP